MALSLPTPPTSPFSLDWNAAEPPCMQLRGQLEAELIPEDSGIPEHERILPRDAVTHLFTRESVKKVLDCWCPKCHDCRVLSRAERSSSLVSEIFSDHGNAQRKNPSSIRLFGLLLYTEFPSLISFFLKSQIYDHILETSVDDFAGSTIEGIVGKAVIERFPRFPGAFHWKKYQFFVPTITEADHQVFSKETILPFANERLIGRPTETGDILSEGSYGRVYSFDIIEGFGDFSEFPGCRRFARKELFANTPESRFIAERSNLYNVKKLRDDHLVKILTTYKHGDTYNLIFPLAITNLHRYLREPQTYFSPRVKSMVDHSLWPQLLGISQALYKVQHFHDDSVMDEDPKFGYHFDLKPANILVEQDGRLVITDFGQAVFKAAKDSTDSRVRGMGGTEAYSPPELNDKSGLNRKYDIWSLGCIFLEVLVFIIGGRIGLLQLDDARVSREPGTRHTDNKFFRSDPFTGFHALKSGILDKIECLHRSLQNDSEKRFFRRILELILRMLDVSPQTRIPSKEVCIRLSGVLNDFQSGSRGSSRHSQSDVTSNHRDTVFGEGLLKYVPSVDLNADGHWRSGPIRLRQIGRDMSLLVLGKTSTSDIKLGSRDSLRFLPQYLCHKPDSAHFLETPLVLMSSESAAGSSTRNCTLECGSDVNAAQLLQESFLAQEVFGTHKLKACVPNIRLRRSIKVAKHFRRGSDIEKTNFGKASAIQLWKESSHADVLAMFRSDRQTPPSTFRAEPSHRRLIIFFDNAVVLLRIAKNSRLNVLPIHVDSSQKSLELVPTRESDSSFTISMLRKQPGISGPSFAVTKESFEAEEAGESLECNSVTLTFYSADEARSFYDIYRAVKKDWKEELKPFDAARRRVGSGHFDLKRK